MAALLDLQPPNLAATAPAPGPDARDACVLAHAREGLRLETNGHWAAAAACYEQALALDPTDFGVTMNLAGMLLRQRRFTQAEERYRQAIALRPQSPAAWSNLAAMLASLKRDGDALACCLHALKLAPQHACARFNMSYPLLRQGRWAEGLLCLEARPSLAVLRAQLNAPEWTGEDLAGRTLLLVSDAGHGDLIQMARYAAALRQRGAGRLIVYGQPGLERLLAQGAGFDQVLGHDEPLSAISWDLWVPTQSLPFHCASRVDALPDRLPYLHAAPADVVRWQAWLDAQLPATGLRLGVVWRGDPRHENDAERSLPGLQTLAPLARLAGVHWVSLQRGAGESEPMQPDKPLPVHPLPARLQDFADTAALVSGLDGVVGVDTSTIHLAGALGKPVWVLLADHLTDWRWLEARSDTPWYPGVMRLMRQREAGDWSAVIDELTDELRAFAGSRGEA